MPLMSFLLRSIFGRTLTGMGVRTAAVGGGVFVLNNAKMLTALLTLASTLFILNLTLPAILDIINQIKERFKKRPDEDPEQMIREVLVKNGINPDTRINPIDAKRNMKKIEKDNNILRAIMN